MMNKMIASDSLSYEIGAYEDSRHAEVLEDLKIGEYGYKYRELDGVIVPPYVTPNRYALSRRLATRPGDICYVSYPKSGSTWLAHIIVLITNNGFTPHDGTLRSHLHWVESSWTYPRSQHELDSLPSPRIFKSHMPYHMALGGDPANNLCKYVYICRNPKDVAVSYYHFERGQTWSGNYDGPWAHWLEMFLDGKLQRGNWFDHVLSWWAHADAENILLLKYEDLLMDFAGQLKKLMDFLGYPFTARILERIRERTSFENMKDGRFSNMREIDGFQGFFRKGQIGSWKEQFTPEQNERFDEVIQKRLQGTGLSFLYEEPQPDASAGG